jgi:hypothetical protein
VQSASEVVIRMAIALSVPFRAIFGLKKYTQLSLAGVHIRLSFCFICLRGFIVLYVLRE